MPAIQLARLKMQSASLVECYSDAQAFVHRLHALLNFYANRAYRPGEAGEPPPLLAAYHVASPVLRQIVADLMPLIQENPTAALLLADALWAESYLEFRQLATAILGRMPSSHAREVLQRIKAWVKPGLEERLWKSCLVEGLRWVREDQPELYKEMIADWLVDRDRFYQRIGLAALELFLQSPAFEDYPWVFRLLSSLVREIHPDLHADLINLMCALARKTPQETIYFLHQWLSFWKDDPNVVRLVRNILRRSSPEFAADLRRVIREEI